MTLFPAELPQQQRIDETADLALWAGQLMLQFGSESVKVEETIQTISQHLGCSHQDIFVAHDAIFLTLHHESTAQTRMKKVFRQGVNFSILTAIDHLLFRLSAQHMSAADIRAQLKQISHIQHQMKPWPLAITVAVGCSAFCLLFGGDGGLSLLCFFAACCGMRVRQYMVKHHYNPLVTTTVSAFAATMISGSAHLLSDDPGPAIAATVLFLVPGVQLINSAGDFFHGYIPAGLTRGVIGFLLSSAIAFGMMVALNLYGII